MLLTGEYRCKLQAYGPSERFRSRFQHIDELRFAYEPISLLITNMRLKLAFLFLGEASERVFDSEIGIDFTHTVRQTFAGAVSRALLG